MSDFASLGEEAGSGGNLPEFSVSEISQAVKRTLEDRFERVRVRGEISGFKRAASGHLYMALKDEKAVLDGVCWKGVAARLAVLPEDGLEVIATGRVTSYPGRSKYQIVIESMELFDPQPLDTRNKIRFIHLNHSRIDNSHVHASFDTMIEESRVHRLSHSIVPSE